MDKTTIKEKHDEADPTGCCCTITITDIIFKDKNNDTTGCGLDVSLTTSGQNKDASMAVYVAEFLCGFMKTNNFQHDIKHRGIFFHELRQARDILKKRKEGKQS